MKLECKTEKLKQAVIMAERITGKNLTLPILSSILFVATHKSLKLRSTNLSLGIEIEIPAKVEKEGVCAVSGSVLSNLFTSLEDESATLELVNNNLSITTKKNTFLLKSLPSDDFPTLPSVEGNSVTLPSKKFIEGIKSVYYSASYSEIKPEISSVHIYAQEDSLIFVSTDSFRLAEKKIKMKELYDFPPLIIPLKNIMEILRIFAEADTELTLVANKNQIVLRTPTVYLTSRIIDAGFPDYRQIIPKSHTTEIIALKQELINALKISNVFSDKFNQVTLSINPSAKKCTISARNADVGENTTEVDSALSGESLEANINYKYLFDCFQSIHQDSVVLRAGGANKPITVAGVSDSSFVYLVMPMNR